MPRAGVALQVPADQHDVAPNIGSGREPQVTADHDNAVANPALDNDVSPDDNRGVGDLFVAFDVDVLAEGQARAGESVG